MSQPIMYPKEEICVRYPGNPILTADDMPCAAKGIYNSGCIKHNGKYVMLCRAETVAMKQFIWPADSDDGINFKLRAKPIQMPTDDPDFLEYTAGMYYDPRVTKIDDTYYVVFACHSGHDCRLGLMKSKDMVDFEWMGFISETDNRNGVLFPEKINGLYARLDRPNTGSGQGYTWISYSPDLVHWGQSRCVLPVQDEWGWKKNGPGAVPIKTDKGWLVIFHAVNVMCAAQYVYHLGVMMLDLKDPSKVLAKAKAPILSPKEDYERVGLAYSVVFTAGAVVEDDGEVKLYYGGGDSVQCLATTTVDKLIDACYNR